ncbi:RHS repeat-associated core domain-containing protein [Pseudomonas purpurea]|uniref:RHS repeat domain-containing protein n=1 Tax=Pseudomonas purpurea TaxID=3136737 RepID=UPI003263B6BA
MTASMNPALAPPHVGVSTRWMSGWRRADAGGNLQTFSRTQDGRLRDSHVQLSGQTARRPVVSAIEYNAEGRIEREVAGNGVRSILKYCPADGRQIERLDQCADGKPLQHLLYAYDRIGNVSSIEDLAMPVRFFANQRIDPISRYRYDSLYQVIEACGWEAGAANKGPGSASANDPAQLANYRQTFRYDVAGNLLGLTHVGAQHPGRELTAARYSNRCLPEREGRPPTEDEIAAAFDANGNLLAMYPGQDLTWNLRHQLHSVRPVVRASGHNDDECYRYDGAGQRVSKVRTLHSRGRSIVSQVRYLPGLELRNNRDGFEVLHVITVQGGLSSVQVLHWETPPPGDIPNDQLRLSLTDHVGSSTLELDGQARVISHETYYPFGETAWFAGQDAVESSYKTLRYSGKERDATGLYYYGFRYYAPGLQRWLNPDPAGAVDGLNRYRAMRNNPLFYRDADGLVPTPNQKTTDSVYHDLSREGVVHPLQAAGMQPIRNFFAGSEDVATQAYRREIPIALEELGAGGNQAFTNTHQAHVIAAARTQTASPSGAVLYHSGEVMSGVMSNVIGEEMTSHVMGPMSVAFNSPIESAQVLAERREAVASVMQVAGKLASFSRNPAVSTVGGLMVAYGRLMKVSESQTQMQYRQLSSPKVPVGEVAMASIIERAAPLSLADAGLSSADLTVLPRSSSSPSSLALRLLEAGFSVNGPAEAPAARPDVESKVPVRKLSRANSLGR